MNDKGIFSEFDDPEKSGQIHTDNGRKEPVPEQYKPAGSDDSVDLSGLDGMNNEGSDGQIKAPSHTESKPENDNEDSKQPDKEVDKKDGLVGSTEKKEQSKDFKSFADAVKMKGGNLGQKKPPKLNKSVILSIIISVGLVLLGVIIFAPADTILKKNDKTNSQPSQGQFGNYEDMAENDPKGNKIDGLKDNLAQKKAEAEEKKRLEEEEKKKQEAEIAANGGINPKYGGDNKPKLTLVDGSTGAVSSVGGSSLDIPDTRNDSLQGKRISGIKGITDSQENYASDYNTKKEENARLAAALNYPASVKSSVSVQTGNGISKEDYTRQLLQAQASQGNSYVQQNDQAGKKDFYNNGKNNNPSLGNYLGLNTIWQGTIFEVVLTSDINTDLPGEITARIAKNIYSSQDSRYLLIPQNSVIYGTYNSSISYAQSRVQVQWNTLVRPDGYQIDLGAMNGTDSKGASGIKGFINDHPGAYLKAIGLMSVFYIANSRLQNAVDSSSNNYVQNVAANSQQIVNELGEKLIDRAMNVQPTIRIKAGTKLNVVANKTISLPPVEDFPVTQKYKRGVSPKELY